MFIKVYYFKENSPFSCLLKIELNNRFITSKCVPLKCISAFLYILEYIYVQIIMKQQNHTQQFLVIKRNTKKASLMLQIMFNMCMTYNAQRLYMLGLVRCFIPACNYLHKCQFIISFSCKKDLTHMDFPIFRNESQKRKTEGNLTLTIKRQLIYSIYVTFFLRNIYQNK